MSRLNAKILKVSSLFGGLQFTNILCSVVRTKLVAVWIGAVGMGLFGIFNSALDMISALATFGLRESAVREVAQAPENEVWRTVKVTRRLALLLGCAGLIIMLCCAPWLSRLSFGDSSHTWAFALLSVIVFTTVVNCGESAVFQGLRRYRKLAYCTMAGTIGGLVVSIPMFYFWRLHSIIPSIMAYGIITWAALGLYKERVTPPTEAAADSITLARTLQLGKRMLTLGFFLTITGFFTYAVSYCMMAYLNTYADTATAGFYQSGFTLVNRYVGLVLSAVAVEYYPRLSAVVAHRSRVSAYVNNQLFMVTAVLTPFVITLMGLSLWVVRLLYSSEFTAVVPFVILAAAGTLLRGISWCMAFVILAKGDGRTYFVTEVSSSLLSIILNIVGFRLGGFLGLGIAYIVWYLCYTAGVGAVYRYRYHFTVSAAFLPYALYALLAAGLAAWLALTLNPYTALPIALLTAAVSLRTLRRKLHR